MYLLSVCHLSLSSKIYYLSIYLPIYLSTYSAGRRASVSRHNRKARSEQKWACPPEEILTAQLADWGRGRCRKWGQTIKSVWTDYLLQDCSKNNPWISAKINTDIERKCLHTFIAIWHYCDIHVCHHCLNPHAFFKKVSINFYLFLQQRCFMQTWGMALQIVGEELIWRLCLFLWIRWRGIGV